MIGIVFPGQGSQFVNMGNDFYNEFDKYREIFDLINDKEKSALNDEQAINETIYAQPILYLNQAAIMNVITNMYDVKDDVYAGFSLGEYQALLHCGVYDVKKGLDIVRTRSEYMDEITSEYTLYVALGVDFETLTKLSSQLDFLISNYNLKDQIVIALKPSNVDLVKNVLKTKGLKRLMKLKVSGPFHTPQYDFASEKFYDYLVEKNLSKPIKQLYLNVSGEAYENQDINVILKEHMVNGVLFYQEMKKMISDGVDTFVEVGSKSVLSSMLSKIDKEIKIIKIQNVDDLDKLEELWNKK